MKHCALRKFLNVLHWCGGKSFKPISVSLSPNVQKDDVFLALRTILQLWNWKSFNVVPRNVPRGSAINAEGTLKSASNQRINQRINQR